jgi:hypothetical protein
MEGYDKSCCWRLKRIFDSTSYLLHSLLSENCNAACDFQAAEICHDTITQTPLSFNLHTALPCLEVYGSPLSEIPKGQEKYSAYQGLKAYFHATYEHRDES